MKKNTRIKFDDGSAFEFSKIQLKALAMKVGKKELRWAIEFLKQDTDSCWKNKVVRTKFGTEKWDEPYANKGHLACDVVYAFIRPYVMSLAAMQIGKKFNTHPLKIMVLGGKEDTIIEGAKVTRGKNLVLKELKGKE